MVYNAGNRKDVRRLEKQARQDEIARQAVITDLMSTVAGRTWVHDRLTAAHIFAPSFSLEALEMAFREGERNAGLQILTDVMQACPQSYVLMMEEANVRHLTASTRNSGSDSENTDGDASGPDATPDDGDTGPEG